MSTICSKVKAIAKLSFFSGKSTKSLKAAVVRGAWVGVDSKGNIHTTLLRDGNCYTGVSVDTAKKLGDALCLLGVIAAEDCFDFIREQAASEKKTDRYWTASRIKADAAALGVKLSAAQTKQIDRIIAEGQ